MLFYKGGKVSCFQFFNENISYPNLTYYNSCSCDEREGEYVLTARLGFDPRGRPELVTGLALSLPLIVGRSGGYPSSTIDLPDGKRYVVDFTSSLVAYHEDYKYVTKVVDSFVESGAKYMYPLIRLIAMVYNVSSRLGLVDPLAALAELSVVTMGKDHNNDGVGGKASLSLDYPALAGYKARYMAEMRVAVGDNDSHNYHSMKVSFSDELESAIWRASSEWVRESDEWRRTIRVDAAGAGGSARDYIIVRRSLQHLPKLPSTMHFLCAAVSGLPVNVALASSTVALRGPAVGAAAGALTVEVPVEDETGLRGYISYVEKLIISLEQAASSIEKPSVVKYASNLLAYSIGMLHQAAHDLLSTMPPVSVEYKPPLHELPSGMPGYKIRLLESVIGLVKSAVVAAALATALAKACNRYYRWIEEVAEVDYPNVPVALAPMTPLFSHPDNYYLGKCGLASAATMTMMGGGKSTGGNLACFSGVLVSSIIADPRTLLEYAKTVAPKVEELASKVKDKMLAYRMMIVHELVEFIESHDPLTSMLRALETLGELTEILAFYPQQYSREKRAANEALRLLELASLAASYRLVAASSIALLRSCQGLAAHAAAVLAPYNSNPLEVKHMRKSSMTRIVEEASTGIEDTVGRTSYPKIEVAAIPSAAAAAYSTHATTITYMNSREKYKPMLLAVGSMRGQASRAIKTVEQSITALLSARSMGAAACIMSEDEGIKCIST